ncbi:MAG: DUF167 family protein [Candidatus Micrarchaeia archaeon]
MIVTLTVVPGSRAFSISSKGGNVKVHLRSPAERNRANLELVSSLSSLLGRGVRIISGQTSRKKRLSIDITEQEWDSFVSGASGSIKNSVL